MKATYAILLALSTPSAFGALVTLDGLTAKAATPTGGLAIATATVGSTIYSNFEQPVSTNISGETVWRSTNTPANDASAILDSFLDTGVLNPGTFQVQFGRTIASTETFIWLDGDQTRLDGADFNLINAAGDIVGDYLLSFGDLENTSDANYPNFTLGTVNRETNTTLSDWLLSGVAFSISDFTGTTGDLATVTGLQVADNTNTRTNNLDAHMLAIATVPEPTSLLLSALGLLPLLRRKR